MTFLGTQPTFTHVPPSLPRSTIPTLAPWCAARRAAAMPPLPAPITRRSKSYIAGGVDDEFVPTTDVVDDGSSDGIILTRRSGTPVTDAYAAAE